MFQRESDGLWMEYVYVDGKRKRISAKTKNDLLRKIREDQIARDKQWLFENIADNWETAHAKTIEATTGSAYTPHVTRAKDFFAGQYVDDITPDKAQAFINSLAKQAYARDTVQRAKSVLNQIFNYAITLPGSPIRYNPVTAVKIPRGLSHTRREPPTEEQIIKINPDTEMGLFACFLLYTGMRRGELLALRWENIDLENKWIDINSAMQYDTNSGHVKDRAKTEAGNRGIPIIDKLLAVLPTDKHSGFVFGGCKPLSATQIRKRWLAWCKENGLAEAKIERFQGKNGRTYTHTVWKAKVTPHQFRHQYATYLFEAGVDELDTKNTMGHASIVVTRDIYQHIRERKKKNNVADKLNTYFEEAE